MKKKLVQFLFSEKGVRVLDELKDRMQVGTRTEVIKIAVSLLWWATERTQNGGRIGVVLDGNGGQPDIAPFWELHSLKQIDLGDSVGDIAKSDNRPRKSSDEQSAKVFESVGPHKKN